MNLSLDTDAFTGGCFCMGGTESRCFCIDRALLDALDRMIEDDRTAYPEEEPLTDHGVVVDGIVSFLRAAGRLPKPYV